MIRGMTSPANHQEQKGNEKTRLPALVSDTPSTTNLLGFPYKARLRFKERSFMKARALVTLTLCCLLSPASILIAQSPSLAAHQQSPAQVYGKLFTSQQKQVVAAAEAMPADKYDFAPTKGSFEGARTFGQQVAHIARAQYDYFENFGIKSGVDVDAVEKLKGKDTIIKALNDSYAFAGRAIATMTEQNAFEEVGDDKTTRAGVAAFILSHTNDHYGQMVLYLRMNDIVPPASRKK